MFAHVRYIGCLMTATKLSIDDLARMTQEELSSLRGEMNQRFEKVEAGQVRLERGMHQVLDVVLELPNKKVIEKLATKVQNIDERLVKVEHRFRTS